MMMIRSRLLACTCIASVAAFAGHAKANQLYFAMPYNYTTPTNTVFVYGAAGVAGSVSSPGSFGSVPFTIGANNVTSVSIPNSYQLTSGGAITNNGFIVQPNNPSDAIGASYLSRAPATTDTTYLLDASGLGTSYYAVGYNNNIGAPSQLTIVGTAANTQVTVTPSSALTSGQPAGTPFTVTLNQGQSVMFGSNTDITGTKVTSTAPVAVFGGSACADVPNGAFACDHLISALPSTDKYTKSVPITKTTGTEGSSSNIVRVLAAEDGTTVLYNGSPVGTINAGQFVEFRSGPGGLVTANNPIVAVEYLTGQDEHPGVVGDPAMSYIPGSDQWLKEYVFSTPVGTEAYQTNFLNLIISPGDVASLLLNGVSVPSSYCTPLAATGYDTCEIAILPGAGNIKADNPFLLLMNGGTQYDSYFTFLGASFSAGASPPPDNGGGGTIVPEPATLGVLGVGLTALGALRRRRR